MNHLLILLLKFQNLLQQSLNFLILRDDFTFEERNNGGRFSPELQLDEFRSES